MDYLHGFIMFRMRTDVGLLSTATLEGQMDITHIYKVKFQHEMHFNSACNNSLCSCVCAAVRISMSSLECEKKCVYDSMSIIQTDRAL